MWKDLKEKLTNLKATPFPRLNLTSMSKQPTKLNIDIFEKIKLISKMLHESETTVDRITLKLEKLMATAQQFTDALKQADDETNRISQTMTDLIAKLQSGGLSSAEEDAALASLQGLADKLKTVGTNVPV